MEATVERDGSAIGALFQHIVSDMKAGTPLWEDFLSKAAKLHTVLKSALSVIAAYLEAFQKIADAATSSRGATKDIGTVLTRICLRHRAVESRLKTFISALMDCLVTPLQDKLDEWRKTAVNLDKEHAKESKKLRTEIKKRSAEASRWQKKAQKICGSQQQQPPQSASCLSAANQEILRAAEAAQLDLAARINVLHETEKQALRSALIEERSRYCLLTTHLKPVMNEEMAMMAELSHLEEILIQLDKHTADPYVLPPTSEQMISELKGCTDNGSWAIQTPPSSPGSLGSRKSSMCSLGSISSSSGSVASHVQMSAIVQQNSPSHGPSAQHLRHRSLQAVNAAASVSVRLSSVSSQDSGFTSQDTLVLRPASPPVSAPSIEQKNPTPNFSAAEVVNERPHTISSAYEKGHQRPALSAYTFQPPEISAETVETDSSEPVKGSNASSQDSLVYGTMKPPLPQRCSSLERPRIPVKPKLANKEPDGRKKSSSSLNSDSGSPAILPDFHQAVPDMIVPQAVYMNMDELRQQQESNPCGCTEDPESGGGIYSSLSKSSGYGSHCYEDGHACACSQCNNWRPHTFACRPVLRRPASFAGYADPHIIASRKAWNLKSPARTGPVKRSSMSSFATLHEVATDEVLYNTSEEINTKTGLGSFEPLDLPPPPDFLLESTLHGLEVQNSPVSAGSNSLSVAATIKTLTAIGHQPVSPVTLRRAQSMRVPAVAQQPVLDKGSIRNMQAIYEAPKLRTGENPDAHRLQQWQRNGHAASDQGRTRGSQAMNQEPEQRHKDHPGEPRVVSGLLSQSNFVHSLNVTLAKQQEQPREGELLHQGATVRRSRTINERTGPRI